MAADRVVSEIVSEFFHTTCQQRRRLNKDDVEVMRASLLAIVSASNVGADAIPLSTGSAAEFYVEPMLPCIGDVDIMIPSVEQIAISQGHLPPTQLPAGFCRRVIVAEIIDSHLPGYVYLKASYSLREITDDGKYSVVALQSQHTYAGHWFAVLADEGPAFSKGISNYTLTIHEYACVTGSMVSRDFVPCIRCLSWPLQSASWPTRRRNHGWPDSATLDRVVRSGCDLVCAAHRQYRQHEWMGKAQWRLSFSRAEVVLINSWMPVQQIIYHMLRSFMKDDSLKSLTVIKDNTGGKILSNYNTKTLMLWACEMGGKSWWIGESNLVGICVTLLHYLADWLSVARCPHYFVKDCNLFDLRDNSNDIQNTANVLHSVTEMQLANWFVEKYICKCVHLCYDNTVLQLFDDISTHVKLQNAVSAFVDWISSTMPLRSFIQWSYNQRFIHRLKKDSLKELPYPSVAACSYLTRKLLETDECLSAYFTELTFLHIAFKANKNLLTNEMLDILSTLCVQSPNVSRFFNARKSSRLSLSQATKLMKVVANNPRSTVQLIEIELSKTYLYRALRLRDSDNDSIYCVAHIYLAVLYYTTGQYQKATGHCRLVTRSQSYTQCSLHAVQGEISPKVHDDIDSALGLAVFYQYLKSAVLNQQEQCHVSVFNTKLFAHYLHIRCQSITECHEFTQRASANDVKQYGTCFSEASQLFITDIMIFNAARCAKYPPNDKKIYIFRRAT